MPERKKRILILSANAGYGHKSASKALFAALEETHGEDCEFEIINALDHKKTPAWLRESQTDYDRIARDMPEIYKFGYDVSDSVIARRFVENGLRVLLFAALKDIVESWKPDAIISTYPLYLAPLNTYYQVSRTFIPTICVVTDLTTIHQIWFSKDADLTIVPTQIVRDLALVAGLAPERVEVVGIPVHPAILHEGRPVGELRAELGWERDLTTILAVGSKRVSRLPEVLNVLNHSGLPLQLIAVAGGDEELYAKLSSIDWHVPAKVLGFVSNMPALVHAADAVASKAGGLIVSESLAAGRPLLIVEAIPGQEEGNADFVVSGGAGDRGLDAVSALEAVRHWTLDGSSLLKRRTERASILGRPRAAFDIVDRAWALAQKGPYRMDFPQTELGKKIVEALRSAGIEFDD